MSGPAWQTAKPKPKAVRTKADRERRRSQLAAQHEAASKAAEELRRTGEEMSCKEPRLRGQQEGMVARGRLDDAKEKAEEQGREMECVLIVRASTIEIGCVKRVWVGVRVRVGHEREKKRVCSHCIVHLCD